MSKGQLPTPERKPYRMGNVFNPRESEKLRDIVRSKTRNFTVSNFDITAFTIPVGDRVNVVTTGIWHRIYFPLGITIHQWTLGADASGSIQFDLWVDSHDNFPPTVADTITASAKPLLSTAISGQSSALTGWKTVIQSGSWLFVNVDSCTTIKQATLCLAFRKGL